MGANGGEVANTVRDTIYRATLLLDDQQWDQWLELCDDSFHYAIKSFSPEINRDMIYLQGTRKELATMVKLLPKHNTDHSPLKRHTTVYTVDVESVTSPDPDVATQYSETTFETNSGRNAELRLRIGDSIRLGDATVTLVGMLPLAADLDEPTPVTPPPPPRWTSA